MRHFFMMVLCLVVILAAIAFPAFASNVQSNVYSAPGSPGNALLTNSAVQVVSGRFNLGNILAYNPNGSVEYIQIFDATAASVALGTSVPKIVVPLPATSTVNVPVGNVTFFTGIAAAATTTPIGTTAPATGITANLVYQ